MNLKKTYRKIVREVRYRADLRARKAPRRAGAAGARRILFFAPDAGAAPHFHMMCMVAKSFLSLGHDVWITRCQGQFDRCPTMACYGLPYALSPGEKAGICDRCTRDSYGALSRYRIPILDLATLADAGLTAEIGRIEREFPRDLENFRYEGDNFGGIAQYEVRLDFKQSFLDMDSEQVRGPFVRSLKSALTSYLLVRKAIRRHGFTDVVYFNNYSLMLAAYFAARKEGVRSCMLTQATHRNIDRRRCVVYTETSSHHVFRLDKRWPRWREVPLAPEMVREIGDEILYRFQGVGSHIFSAPKSLDGIPAREQPSRKRVVAYTSSPDEYVGAYHLSTALGADRPEPRSVFGGDLIDCHVRWLEQLCRHAADRPETDFVIRIHPREGAKKNVAAESQHLPRLRECLRQVPANCTVIWPDDPVSSYDLGETADLVLVSWSTIGVEMARLGLPVLRCTDGVSGVLADHFQSSAADAADYFRKMDALLAAPPSFDRIKFAYRWWNYNHLAGSIDLSDLIPASDYGGLPPFHLPARAAELAAAVLDQVSPYEINLPAAARQETAEGRHAEELALRMQCRRLFHYLLLGRDEVADDYIYIQPAGDAERFIEGNRWLRGAKARGVVVESGGSLAFFDREGREWKRHSPMAAFLGFFGAAAISVCSAWEQAAPASASRIDGRALASLCQDADAAGPLAHADRPS